MLGLLQGHGLIWLQKAGRGEYRQARWDTLSDVRQWLIELDPQPDLKAGWAVFSPRGDPASRLLDSLIPHVLPGEGFLSVSLKKKQ